MPCGSLAVQQALLEANIAEELIRSPELREHFRAWLSEQLGAHVTAEVTDEWVTRRRHRRIKGGSYVRLTATAVGLTLTVSVKNGISLFDTLGQFEIARAEKYLTALAQAAIQERLVQAIAQVARIKSDEPLPNGMRTLQLEV